jgi:catechol 2,3-dioxygenase-like lactoylglutathione lyase family enzyme
LNDHPRLTGIAPQLLVTDLQRSIDYYRRCLGFQHDFTYDGFYAGISRDGCSIHLKHGETPPAERKHRGDNEHIDAMIEVSNAPALFEELTARRAVITTPLENRPWACRDFYVEDPDGYLLCFFERIG